MDKSENSQSALRTWLWISVLAALIGAAMLYPIGGSGVNFLFLLIKAGMVTGLIMMLRGTQTSGFRLWAWCSALAVLMTIIKWSNIGHARTIFILAIITDIVMPTVADRLRRKS